VPGSQPPALSRFTRGLCAFALVCAVLAPALLHAVSPFDPTYTVVHHLKRFVRGEAFADSWDPMRAALRAFREDPDVPLYQKVFFESGTKFQYPPTSLLLLDAWEHAPAPDPLSNAMLNGLSQIMVAITLVLAVALFLRSVERVGPPAVGPLDTFLRLVAALALAATFHPVLRAFTLGQLQTWVNALAAVALFATAARAPGIAGAAAGFACTLKPQLGLLLLWALVRREHRFALSMLATAGAFGAVSLAVFGLDDHLAYLDVLQVLSAHGESLHTNQSVNGLLHRWLGNGPNLEWIATAYPPFHPIVYAGTLGSSLGLVGIALFWRRREHAAAPELDLGIAVLAFTLASPIAWEHHYGVLLPILAWMAPMAIRDAASGPALGVALALAWLLTGQLAQVADLAAGTAWTPLQSYRLAGGVLTLALLFRLRGAAGEAPPGRRDEAGAGRAG
jgi:hypothetical protein